MCDKVIMMLLSVQYYYYYVVSTLGHGIRNKYLIESTISYIYINVD